MPVDTTRVIAPRRTQRKLTEEELKDIDQKRLRGELSCAECRRLKLKCDKSVPCASCLRRGCESICPLGILAAGQGTRFILADTDQLHQKIYQMSNRIRQLEDALAILQSAVSDQRHPLLAEELLRIKFGSEAISPKTEAGVRMKDSSDSKEKDVDQAAGGENVNLDALGTLTLGSSGEMQYFGRSAGSETLMMKADEETEVQLDDDLEQESTNALRPLEAWQDIERLANLFPFSSKNRPNVVELELLENYLPSQDRASQLCESYVKHGSYFFRPIKQKELVESLVPRLYDSARLRKDTASLPKKHNEELIDFENSPESERSASEQLLDEDVDIWTPHALATLFLVFAIGALLDLKNKPYNSEAELYYDLGRAALSSRAVYDSPSMETVQAMGLMATYHTLAGKRYSRDSAWCLMSSTAKLAQSIGLHRDSSRWNMDANTVQARRNLFWEVLSADVSHSLALGRPPAIHLAYVDCEFPIDDDPSLGSGKDDPVGFWRMKHKFARDIYYSVANTTLAAKSPNYHTVLELDKKVREVSFPPTFNPYVKKAEVGNDVFHSSELCIRDFYASQHRTVTMLYLHRSFFAQAMLDHPKNPLLSNFAPSFLTAYRSASVVIKATAYMFDRCAEMATRLWFLMYHTFSAAVIAGTVVTRSPNWDISNIAMRDFELAFSLFERAAEQSHRAKIALGVLHKLQEKAKLTRAEMEKSTTTLRIPKTTPADADNDPFVFEHPNPMDVSPAPTSTPRSVSVGFGFEDIEDDLAIFGGHTRIIDRKAGRHVRMGSVGNLRISPSAASVPSTPKTSEQVTPISATLDVAPDPSVVSSPPSNVNPQNLILVSPPLLGPVSREPSSEAQEAEIAVDDFSDVLPEVHPSLLSYLNQDAVKKVRGSNRARWDLSGQQPSQTAGTPGSQSQSFRTWEPNLSTQISLPPANVWGSSIATSPMFLPPSDLMNMSTHPEGPGQASLFGGSGPFGTQDAAGIIEMGLSGEGGLDEGWMSLMRDCGIMPMQTEDD